MAASWYPKHIWCQKLKFRHTKNRGMCSCLETMVIYRPTYCDFTRLLELTVTGLAVTWLYVIVTLDNTGLTSSSLTNSSLTILVTWLAATNLLIVTGLYNSNLYNSKTKGNWTSSYRTKQGLDFILSGIVASLKQTSFPSNDGQRLHKLVNFWIYYHIY